MFVQVHEQLSITPASYYLMSTNINRSGTKRTVMHDYRQTLFEVSQLVIVNLLASGHKFFTCMLRPVCNNVKRLPWGRCVEFPKAGKTMVVISTCSTSDAFYIFVLQGCLHFDRDKTKTCKRGYDCKNQTGICYYTVCCIHSSTKHSNTKRGDMWHPTSI